MRFRKDPHFERNLLKQPAMKDALKTATGRMVSAARTLAPTGTTRTDRYRESFYVAEEGDMVALASSDPGSVALEFGSRNNSPHATERRAVGAAGYRFRDEGP